MFTKIFKDQLGRNIETYIDDILVKSPTFEYHLQNLQYIFSILYQYWMKLNLLKCTFAIQGGEFLGFSDKDRA